MRAIASMAVGAVTAAALAGLAPAPARACPCITLVNAHAEEVAQRAMLVVEDDAIDYILELAVEGDAQEVGWIVPTPVPAEDPEMLPPEFFIILDGVTAPPLYGCSEGGGCTVADSLKGDVQAGGANGVEVFGEGRLGNLDFAVVASDDSAALQTWLDAKGYSVSSEAQAGIDAYVAKGWAFVALRLSGASGQSGALTLGPLRIRVPSATAPVFPLGMTALSASERVSLLLYLVAPQRLKPANYPLVEIDGDALERRPDGNSNYQALVRDAIDAEGKGFVVEHMGEAFRSYGTEDLGSLLEGKQLVRLYTDVAPSALDRDLELEVDADLEAPRYPCVPEAGAQAGCAAGRRLAGAWGPLALALGALWLLHRRRRA